MWWNAILQKFSEYIFILHCCFSSFTFDVLLFTYHRGKGIFSMIIQLEMPFSRKLKLQSVYNPTIVLFWVDTRVFLNWHSFYNLSAIICTVQETTTVSILYYMKIWPIYTVFRRIEVSALGHLVCLSIGPDPKSCYASIPYSCE